VTRLEELLVKLQDGSADAEELRELTGLLETREARAALVDDFFMTQAIRGHLGAAEDRKATPPRIGSRRFTRTRRSLNASSSRTWAWVAAGILMAIFLTVLFSSSSEEAPKKVARTPGPERPATPRIEPEAKRASAARPSARRTQAARDPAAAGAGPGEARASGAPARASRGAEARAAASGASGAQARAGTPEAPGLAGGRHRAHRKDRGDGVRGHQRGQVARGRGAEFAVGQGLETAAPRAGIVLAFPDKTRIELGPESALSDVKLDAGTRLLLAAGTIRPTSRRKPKDRPSSSPRPTRKRRCWGTILRVVADRDPKKGTLLEVDKGRVELRRLAIARAVVVGSGPIRRGGGRER
jgi:hypothetical protein